MYPWGSDTLLRETSVYTWSEEIVHYMKSERPKKCILGRENDRGLKVVPCREDNQSAAMNPDGKTRLFY